MIVSIDDIVTAITVSRQVKLLYPLNRDAVDEILCRKSVVKTADVDIVDVEQQQAISLFRDRRQKRPLAHFRLGVGDVAGHIFQQNAPPQKFLYLLYAGNDVAHSRLGIRQRHEIVQITIVHPGPAQMIGYPRRFDMRGQGF